MIHELCQHPQSALSLRSLLTEIKQESEDRLQIILSEKNDAKYTALHVAIFERNVEAVKILVEFGADGNAKCHGTPCLQLSLRAAAQPGNEEVGISCFEELLKDSRINITAKDDNAMTVLHLAAFYNFSSVISSILSTGEGRSLLNQCSQATGITPLHMAAMAGAAEATKLLLESGASPAQKLVICGSTALHTAAISKSSSVWAVLVKFSPSLLTAQDHAGYLACDIVTEDGWTVSDGGHCISSNQEATPTAIVYGSLCSEHYTCIPEETRTNNAPPENLHRLHVLINEHDGILKSRPLSLGEVKWSEQTLGCPLADVLRVHEWSYVRRVQSRCENIPEDIDSSNCIGNLDGDTAVCSKTFKAALVAAGAVCSAVDKVASGIARNAFCPVRPPGHHAGPLGAVKGEDGSESHGFCILNNVSIGASYAMNHYRDKIKKVAIVDFDVHHGNGTEETIRWLKPHCTMSEYYNNNGFGKMYTPRYKPWFGENDSENVLFVSVHGYGPRQRGLEHLFPVAAFYPGSGATKIPQIPEEGNSDSNGLPPAQRDDEPLPESMVEVDDNNAERNSDSSNSDDDDDFDDMNVEEESVASMVAGNPVPTVKNLLSMYEPMGNRVEPLILDIGVALPEGDFSTPFGRLTEETKYRFVWRNYFRNTIFPRLMKFKPDMIFISAGFDAHKKDSINAGYISLVEEDFQWITEKLVEIANYSCEGRVVSVLEGGYQLGGEYTSAFAKSVFGHVQSLAIGAQSRRKFDKRRVSLESNQESKVVDQLAKRRDEEIYKRMQARLEQEARQKAELEAYDLSVQQHQNETQESAEGGAARKRRRPQVDYVALNKELDVPKPN